MTAPARRTADSVLGPTSWRLIDQREVDVFAGITGDRQWIHTDVERAERESPFGGTIAHGSLMLALIDGFRDELVPPVSGMVGVNYGYERVRFPRPLRVGTRVRATLEVVSVAARPDGGQRVVQRFRLESEAGETVCIADNVVVLLGPQALDASRE